MMVKSTKNLLLKLIFLRNKQSGELAESIMLSARTLKYNN